MPKIKKILISQPEPADLENSPYRALVNDYKLNLTFYKFFEVQGISVSEFRKNRIHIKEYSAVILNSKNSVDHYFRMAKELREQVPESMKYFCTSENIALYLQNYIQYRKRKIFFGKQFFAELIDVMSKHRDEKFLFPCSDERQTEYTKLLDKAKFKYTRAPMYRSVPRDLTHFNLKDFDMVALFSPIGVRSLVKNFPDFKGEGVVVAAFGTTTHAALKEAGIKLQVKAPTPAAPSMAMAIENYILGRPQEDVIVARPSSLKSAARGRSRVVTATLGSRKTKPVIANKERYRQRMEEKKAQAAARRAEREKEKAVAESNAKQKAAAKAKPVAPKAALAKVAVTKTTVTKAAPAKTKTAAVKPAKVAKTTATKTAKTPVTKAKTATTKTTKSTAAKKKK